MTKDATDQQSHHQPLMWLSTTLRIIGPTITSVIIISGLSWTLARPFVETFIVNTVKDEQFVSAATLNFALNRIEVLERRITSLEKDLKEQTSKISGNRDDIRILLFRAGGFEGLGSALRLDRPLLIPDTITE